MGAIDRPLVAALLSPVSPQDFFAANWPSQPLEVHGQVARLPATLRDPAFASAGTLAQRYGGRLRFTHGGSDQMVTASDANAAALLDMGLTVQFVDLDGCVSGVRAFCREIETELGLHEGAVSMSAFAASRDNGLPCHYDAAELLSVQLVGGKRFHYARMREVSSPCGSQFAPNTEGFDDLYPQATAGFPDPHGADFAAADMLPGSVLFLPRGYWHYTSASESSLSVSIAINAPPVMRSLLDQLRCLLLQDERWRRPLYGSGDRDEARRRVEALLATLPQITARLSPDDIIDAPARAGWRLSHVEARTRFVRTPHGRVELGAATSNGKMSLRFIAGQRPFLSRHVGALEITAATEPLLRWLEERSGAFTFAECADAHPDVPAATLKEVLRLCTQAEFLRVLWYPALDAAAH